eukprot:m.137988 g.137988  ORF g.137988 m.137988 type:complete len:339 (-) comp17014_c0_seq2:145-1161(-)
MSKLPPMTQLSAQLEEMGEPPSMRHIVQAAASGDVQAFGIILERAGITVLSNCRAMKIAAEHGHIEAVQWLHDHDVPWNEYDLRAAAQRGHLDVVRWMHDQGCPWTADIAQAAASGGFLDVLKYLREQGCVLDSKTVAMAACGRNTDTIKWLRSVGCEWSPAAVAQAAQQGDKDMICYLLDGGCPMDEQATRCAAMNGHIACLTLLLDRGCPVNTLAATFAAKEGHRDVIQLLLDRHGGSARDCTDWETACEAASGGHFDLVKLLHTSGCAITARLLSCAAQTGDVEMVKYLREEAACPWDAVAVAEADAFGRHDLLAYLDKHGCPWDPQVPRPSQAK